MSVLSCLNSFCQGFDSLVLCEVYSCVCAHFLSEFKTLCVSVYCTDVLNTHGVENCDTDQTDRSASLNNNSAVEFEDACCFCSFYCMYKYCAWLDQDTGIQIQITYVEECRSEGSASDQDVIREPSVKMYIIIWKKSVYISSTNVFLVEVEHCDFRIIFEDHTCNNFIADFNWFSSCINFNVFTHFYDFTSSLMSKSNRDQAKWISFEFVCVSTADTASFYFNKDIVIANFRHWEFFDFIMFQCCKHCNMCCFWDYRVSCRSYWSCCCRSCCSRCISGHSGKNLFYNFFDIYIVHIHFNISS